MCRIITILFTILLRLSCIAQSDTNLVVNPSFEDYHVCPDTFRHDPGGMNMTEVKHWHVASKGTPDYLNKCSTPKECGVPENKYGFQHARTGNAYAGLVASTGGNYREYIQSKLKDTLTGGVEYYAEFYIVLAELSKSYVNTLGLYLSKNIIQTHNAQVMGYTSVKKAKFRENYEIMANTSKRTYATDTFYRLEYIISEPVIPQVKMQGFIKDTMQWIKVSGTFIAEGGERYITIGSFEKTENKKRKGRNRKKIKLKGKFVKRKHAEILYMAKIGRTSYYYIDDVVVRPVTLPIDTITEVKVSPIDTVQTMEDILLTTKQYTLKNLQFDTDKYSIRDSSYSDLDSLVRILHKHPDISIEINGHTDNVGDYDHNIKLSFNRAIAVKNYLEGNGIEANRLKSKGHGSKIPVAPNDSEAGRQLNRRVEIVVIDE